MIALAGALSPDAIRALLGGLVGTLEVTAVSIIVALVIAFAVGISRTVAPNPVGWILTIYVETFRGTSALIQLFVCYFVLPFIGLRLPAFVAACLALALNSGAYGAIIVGSAIRAVDPGQVEAAEALHLSKAQRMRYVVMPQAVPRMLPPLGNLLVEHLKMTSLVSLVTVTDLTLRAQSEVQAHGHAGQIYLITLVLYFVVCYPLSRAARHLESEVGAASR